jgi:hypothetical protein
MSEDEEEKQQRKECEDKQRRIRLIRFVRSALINKEISSIFKSSPHLAI